jgi:ankyrin repeat protein
MRAKFIYEKFTEDNSDPIHDMGIGMIQQIIKFCSEKTGYFFYKIPDDKDDCLIICAENKKYEFVDFLLCMDDINVNYRQALAFRWLSHYDNIIIMKKFIDKGVDVNFDIGGETALTNAIDANNFQVVKFLVNNGANIREEYIETIPKGNQIYKYLKKKFEEQENLS